MRIVRRISDGVEFSYSETLAARPDFRVVETEPQPSIMTDFIPHEKAAPVVEAVAPIAQAALAAEDPIDAIGTVAGLIEYAALIGVEISDEAKAMRFRALRRHIQDKRTEQNAKVFGQPAVEASNDGGPVEAMPIPVPVDGANE